MRPGWVWNVCLYFLTETGEVRKVTIPLFTSN